MKKHVIVAVTASLVLSTTTPLLSGQIEGFAEPYRTVDLSSAVEPSVITAINVREGTTVAEGDVMAELDTSLLEASLTIAKRRTELVGKLKAAQADIDVRKTRFEKLTMLRAKGHATQAELDRAESELAIAEANHILAVEELELYKLECRRIESQIKMHTITSPIDGVVVQVYSEAGETTSMTSPVLMTLVQLSPLRVKFSVSVPQAADLTEGETLPIHLPEIGQDAEAKVEVIAPVLDARSGTVQVTCLVENADRIYRSGMRCLLNLPGDDPAPQNSTDEPAKDDPFGF